MNYHEQLTKSLEMIDKCMFKIMEDLPECFIGTCPFYVLEIIFKKLKFGRITYSLNTYNYYATYSRNNIYYEVNGNHSSGTCKINKLANYD